MRHQGGLAARPPTGYTFEVAGAIRGSRIAWAVVLLAVLLTSCAPAAQGDDRRSDAPAASTTCAAVRVDLDIPGPGQPTPEEAVAPYAGAGRLVLVSEQGKTATVDVVGPEGQVFRVFEVTKHRDGWWPDGYTQC